MTKQITDTIMMIRPVAFRKNEETAENNYYQQSIEVLDKSEIQLNAEAEFDGFVNKLRDKGIKVIVFEDKKNPSTPDSIFPNNWVTFDENGMIMLFPIFAENRRGERREDIISYFRDNYDVSSVDDLIRWEGQNKFLESTGSMILDRQNKILYAAISDRTHPEVIDEYCQKTGYRAMTFSANQTVGTERLAIYHTNVMMCLGERFAVICLDTIDDISERERVIESLENTGKEIIEIDEIQNNSFAGNMLQVVNSKGERFIAMSDSAYWSLSPDQVERLEKHGEIIHSALDTIETCGGGSARCMMAEVFLPEKVSSAESNRTDDIAPAIEE
ncbi:MAG: arginine deiminase-related protein [Cyclobacteriaceae bacterium]